MTQDTTAKKTALAKGRDLYSPEVTALIAKIEGVQKKLKTSEALKRSWSDEVFCLGCASMKANRWSQLRAGVYPYPSSIPTQNKLLRDLEALATFAHQHELEVKRAELEAKASETQRAYLVFPEYKEILTALEEIEAKAATTSQVRAVVFVGKTGFGKTETLKQLLRTGKVQWSVCGLPGWRKSYAAFLSSLGMSLGLSLPRGNWHAEQVIMRHLATVSGVLAIEEIEALSNEALEFLKAALNGTRITLLLLLTPDSYRRVCGAPGLSEQLNRRTHLTLSAGPIDAAKIRAFAPDLWKGVKDDDQRFTLIASQANQLGGLCCVQSITDELATLHHKDRLPPSVNEVNNALAFYAGTKRKQSLLVPAPRFKIAA